MHVRGFEGKSPKREGGDIHAWGYEAGDYDWTMSNDLPRFREESTMPAATTDWLLGSFRWPKAASLTPIGPLVCASTGPRRDPRDPECFAAARASVLQPSTDLPHQVSYGQHVTPQISWPPLTSTQRDRLTPLGRRNRFGIKEAAVWHRELRFDHLSDQLVFIVQELHHFQRGCGGLISRRLCHHGICASPAQAQFGDVIGAGSLPARRTLFRSMSSDREAT